MLSLINTARQADGKSEVGLEGTAIRAGQNHAQEMAAYAYLNHRNLEGYGPDHRYTFAGGLHAARENVYARWHSPGGGPASQQEWQEIVEEAHRELMDSEGHRANILSPEHTHVGIGMVYEPSNGTFASAQEFTNQYVRLDGPLPSQVPVGGAVTLEGRLERGATNPLISLAYEPFPEPMGLSELKQVTTYVSPATQYDALLVEVDEGGRFGETVRLDHQGQAGLYHVRIFVDTQWGQALASDLVVRVQ
jgi:hypothetical protein